MIALRMSKVGRLLVGVGYTLQRGNMGTMRTLYHIP
jgi:hypothetical protein